MSNNYKAIFYVILSTFIGSFFAVILKSLYNELQVTTIGFFRFFFGLLILSPLILRNNFAILKTSNLKLYFLRSSLNVFGMLFNFTALGLLTLEKSAAFGFVSPIYATIFAVLILKEKIRIYRVTALIIGFIGVIIIAQPSLSGVEKGVYFALLGQLCFGMTMVLIKKMSYKDSSLTILSYQYILTSFFLFLLFVPFFEIPNSFQFLQLATAAFLGTFMHYFFNQAIRLTEVTFLTPFKYLGLIFASIFGFVYFGDVPSVYTWIGGTILFSSMLIITIRENQLSKDIVKKSDINNL